MKMRKLGNSGLMVAPLCFGGNVFGWTADEATSFRLLDALTEAGFNFIDTADVYSKWAPGNKGGESETILGKWLRQSGKRTQIVLATKAGSEMAPDKKGLSKAYIRRAVEDSLRRLQTDSIDLYQSHYDDPQTPVEETMEAFAGLLQAGKVRAIGASNFTPERLEESLAASKRHGWPPYTVLQPHYNLCERENYETRFEPICAREGLGVIPYFSLASGFLTGKYRSKEDAAGRARGKFVEKYMDERGFRILGALEEVARERGAKPAQVAIAWLLARPSVTAPIASATTLEQLRELLAATELRLNAAAIERLNAASA
jgi:aryl-alcohol dehydrogenase-like predicted oxidoreductase